MLTNNRTSQRWSSDRWWPALRVLVVCVMLLGSSAWTGPQVQSVAAEEITVCSTCDYQTIQAALDASSTGAGDVIVVAAPVHTEDDVSVRKDVTIRGASAEDTIVQAAAARGDANDRVFSVESGATVIIEALTIRYGRVLGMPSRGGGVLNRGVLTLRRVLVADNDAVGLLGDPGGEAQGGGVHNDGVLIVEDSTIAGNLAEGGAGNQCAAGEGLGGGIFNEDGAALTVVNSTISGNAAQGGIGYG